MEKKKASFTIIAGILSGMNLVAVIALVIALFFPYSTIVFNLFFLAIGFGIAGIILAIICHRERIKKLWIALLVANIVFTVAEAGIISPLYGVKSIYTGIAESAVEKARENAKIEYAKSLLPEKGLILHNEETKDSTYHYFDDDGAIVAQFEAMEFTLDCDSSCYGLSDTYFDLGDVTITFASEFDGVVIHAVYGTFWGFGEAYKSYSVDLAEGQKIKKMIDDKITEQKSAYEAAIASVEAETSLATALTDMETDKDRYEITLVDAKYEVGLTRQDDPEKKLLQAFKEVDDSKLGAWTAKELSSSDGFYYEAFPFSENAYYLHYLSKDHCLIISRRYDGPYDKEMVLNVYYSVDTEVGDHLMEVAEAVVAEQEANENDS